MATAAADFTTVTEQSGDEVSREQIERCAHRYLWAGRYCAGKDVIEAACGTGPGLGHLASIARSLKAGDFTAANLDIARAHYGNRVELLQFDAQEMPFPDRSADVVILFEALYYLPDAEKFVAECRRMLRPGGVVLIATANKDLYDFNPSPHSHRYYGVVELGALFDRHGFDADCFGYCSFAAVSLRQRALRGVKKFAVKYNLIPKTQASKKFLKRFVFGKLEPMPAEVGAETMAYAPPTPLPLTEPDRSHKVIYCAATLRG